MVVTKYVIKDYRGWYFDCGTQTRRRPQFTKKKSEATKFKTEKSASNKLIEVNCLMPSSYAKVDLFEEIVVDNDKEKEAPVLPKKPISRKDIFEAGKEKQYNIKETMNDFYGFLEYIEERNTYLIKKLSEVEEAIIDIEHACEFYELNASQGYAMYKLMHENRKLRREIKNELAEIRCVRESGITLETVKKIAKRIEAQENKNYNPRVMQDLFDAK